ncbi:hypothetical protein KDU71_00005 [Carboxylicivirga sediminis]|uniref:Uncharacterized protein n=1 Tax=Carboxylicivirga sediminis TaxID=2006564 RepID=A0A941ISL0_9BACT|nr:hypothetical protein [Carboxylicivirga sediminis]MBR8533926.1 hypothetical protein [Carboxylicivirga sediminis]
MEKSRIENKIIQDKKVKRNAWITWGIIVLLGLIWLARDIYKTVEKENRFSGNQTEETTKK